jgi:hypothetical protein
MSKIYLSVHRSNGEEGRELLKNTIMESIGVSTGGSLFDAAAGGEGPDGVGAAHEESEEA